MNTKQIVENHIVNMHNISKACDEIRKVKKHHIFYDVTKVRKELEERAKEAFVDVLEKELIKFEHRYKSEIVDEAKEFFGISEDKKIQVGTLVNVFEVNGHVVVETNQI